MAVNSMDYSGKDTVLDVIRVESDKFFKIVDEPKNWNVQTRCTEWEVRDMVGHMLDVTEGYLTRWDKAQRGEPANTAGLLVMAESLNKGAQYFRKLPREEAIARLKNDYGRMMTIFEGLTPEQWGSFNVMHPYMGALPSLFYPAFHVMDYGVHTWDMNWGLGHKTDRMDERTAGVLVPFMIHALLPSTVDQESAKGLDVSFGIVVDGEWGGKWRVKVKDGQFSPQAADNLDDVQATFHFHNASDFVLTSFQRFPGGDTSGDPQVVEQIRHLFFRI
jgi:uncharacterized protein (TIGR03083 family)